MLRIISSLVTVFAIVILAVTLSTPTLAGNPANEAEFKKILVGSSPWSVSWENDGDGGFASGTHKMRFTNDGTVIAGELFDDITGEWVEADQQVYVVAGLSMKLLTGVSALQAWNVNIASLR